MQYGRFDDQNREYIITNPKTPVKWINYIGKLSFGGFIDHTGGALLCCGDPALNRITKYIPQLPASDFRGTTLYLRIKLPSGYQVFSPYFTPTLDPYSQYECHVGLGYSHIVSEFYRIRTEVTIFIPLEEQLEIRIIRVTNLNKIPREIDVIPVVEYTHFDALKQLTNADWVPQTMQSRVYPSDWQPGSEVIPILTQYAFMRRDSAVNYLTSNWPVSSYESERRFFLGEYEYGSWAKPLSLHLPELTNSQTNRGDNIGALMHHLGILHPGETKVLITQLGQVSDISNALPIIEKYRQSEAVDSAFDHLRLFWDDYLSKFQVQTPDRSMNHMLNVHNPRQCYVTKTWSRYLSLYQLGFGARGIGFRDSSQDALGVLVNAPSEGMQLIRQLIQVQRRDGSAMHQFNPLTMVANAGDAREAEEAPQYYSDDHLWLILAVTAYLKETGDFNILDQVIPYYEKKKNGQPLETGTVLDHLERAISFTHMDIGAHGFPLLGFADWNDTVNLQKGAESLFTAFLFGKALKEMMELSEYQRDSVAHARYQQYYQEMSQRVNEQAWDGAWYIRYLDYDGQPLGSKINTQGQIYVNAQSWAVISGFAPLDRARRAMDSVYDRLNTPKGIKLSAPGYNGFDPRIGGISTYPPGAKENGGIFLHTNPWAMVAETILGNGNRAYEYYRQINPGDKNDQIDEYECEPYVYAQNILGDEHPEFGLARNSWLSGTASWVYQAAMLYILGIRPTYHGLLIDPCIPDRWDGFKARRKFRNTWFEIEVHNPNHIQRGIQRLIVDGQDVSGGLLTDIADKPVSHVQAWMS